MKFKATVLVSLFLLAGILFAQNDKLYNPPHRLWVPDKDEVYLQEVTQKVATTDPVQSVAFSENDIYAVINNSIYKLSGYGFVAAVGSPNNANRLISLDNKLWALTDEGLFQLLNSNWKKLLEGKVVDLCLHWGQIHAATRNDIFRFENGVFVNIKPKGGYLSSDITVVMEDGSQVLSYPVRLGPISRIVSYSGTIYILSRERVIALDGKVVNRDVVDFGTLPSPNTKDVAVLGSRLFVSTDRGLGVLRGASMTTLKGVDGLPYENTTCLANGFDNDLWIGTTTGAIRMLKDDWHYFGATHWLPATNVHDIAVSDHKVAIATDGGIGIISYEPYTLAKKADHYEQIIDTWGFKRLGFIHTIYRHGDDWIREISDNDGGHTAPYLAAMCYKYAVTGDEETRKKAVDSFKAMVWLDQITPKPGFIARAIWSTTGDEDKMATGGSGGLPAKWYPTKDGKWYWKGDTSSDEVDAHIYAVSLFHDLVAQGEEKELAKQHLTNIAGHIIDNGWVLMDMDGKPTRWGRWDPDYLLRAYGYAARGLNGLQAQTYMITAYGVSGDQKFKDGLEQTLKWGYHKYTVRQKVIFPPEDIASWDDDLANRCYYTMFRYVDDKELLSIYLRSLERTYELKRMEHIPWFNFTYGAVTGNDCEVKQSVKHLREWTLDCVEHDYTNSHRTDLYPEPGYDTHAGGTKAMSPRETSVKRGSRNALPYDSYGGSKRALEPTGFLRDYWMGRYHGFISAPQTDGPDLVTAPKQTGQHIGAKPYKGPDRPEIKLVK